MTYTVHICYSEHRTSDIEVPYNYGYGKGTITQSMSIQKDLKICLVLFIEPIPLNFISLYHTYNTTMDAADQCLTIISSKLVSLYGFLLC